MCLDGSWVSGGELRIEYLSADVSEYLGVNHLFLQCKRPSTSSALLVSQNTFMRERLPRALFDLTMILRHVAGWFVVSPWPQDMIRATVHVKSVNQQHSASCLICPPLREAIRCSNPSSGRNERAFRSSDLTTRVILVRTPPNVMSADTNLRAHSLPAHARNLVHSLP